MQQVAGIVIIAGFIIFWVGNVYSPPGVYQETDSGVRLGIVKQYPARWALSQGLGGVGMAGMIIGLVLLSVALRGQHSPWLLYLPAGLGLLSAVLAAAYTYSYITDPVSNWEGTHSLPLLRATALLMLGSGLLYGILFLQAGLPAWLAYLSIAYTAIGTAALLLLSMPTFYVLGLYSLILLAVGIALVR